MRLALSSASGSVLTLLPSATARNTGPLLVGWRLVAGELVVAADGGCPAADGAGLAAVAGQAGEVGGDDAHVRRQGCGALRSLPRITESDSRARRRGGFRYVAEAGIAYG